MSDLAALLRERKQELEDEIARRDDPWRRRQIECCDVLLNGLEAPPEWPEVEHELVSSCGDALAASPSGR